MNEEDLKYLGVRNFQEYITLRVLNFLHGNVEEIVRQGRADTESEVPQVLLFDDFMSELEKECGEEHQEIYQHCRNTFYHSSLPALMAIVPPEKSKIEKLIEEIRLDPDYFGIKGNTATKSRPKIENEDKIVRALTNYYTNFLTEQGRRLINWCRDEELRFDRVVDYMRANDLGMPETQEGAKKYLRRVAYQRLKALEKAYESGELSAGSAYSQLVQLEEKFEKISDSVDEKVSDQFYELYWDLELRCSEDMESDGRIEKMTKELEMGGKIINPRACIKRLKDLKQRYESGQLTEQQASTELRGVYQDFKAPECGPNKKALNEFCDLYLDLESRCGAETGPEETQEDFAAKLWVLKIDEIEAKARDEIKTIGDEEILSLYGAHCNEHYFGSKRKYDFLRKELKATPNREFAAVKYLFEEYCQQLEVLEQVKKRKLINNCT